MDQHEVIAVILLTTGVFLTLSGLTAIASMIGALVSASPQQVTSVKAIFAPLKWNAVIWIWLGAVVTYIGMTLAPRENEEIRDLIYVSPFLVAIIGTILALFI